MLTRGNQTLTWDIDNRVSSIAIAGGGSTSMEYDYAGVRVKKNAPGGISIYPFAGYEIDPSGVVTKYIRVGDESVASKRGANKYFYHNDHLGSVNVITDINGTRIQLNEYDPWGAISRSEGTIDPTHRFTGKELDPETGLYYYSGRYYDAEIGRFVSADPFVQDSYDPQNLNRYSYVLNSPQNYTDPSGYFHQIKKKKTSFWKSGFGIFFRFAFNITFAALNYPINAGPFSEGYGFGGGPWYQVIQAIRDAVDDKNTQNRNFSESEITGGDSPGPQVPGLSNAGGGGFFSPALRLAAETGCDDCSDASWGWLRILSGLFRTGIAAAAEDGEKPTGSSPSAVRRPPPPRSPGSPVGPTDYVALPNGRVIPIPQGWQGRVANNGQGVIFQKPGSPNDANSIRIMDPNRQNPNGYVKLTDSKGNALDVNGNKVSPNSAAAHIPQNYQGQIPALRNLYGRTP